METNQDLQNKSASAADAGAPADKSTGQAPSAEELKAEAEKLLVDAEADAETVGKKVSNLLRSGADAVEALVEEVKDDVETLVEEGKALVEDAVDFAKAKLGSEVDAEHDAALRAQYDATHELAANGGDGAENQS